MKNKKFTYFKMASVGQKCFRCGKRAEEIWGTGYATRAVCLDCDPNGGGHTKEQHREEEFIAGCL